MLYRFLLCAAVVLFSCSGAFAIVGHPGCHPVGHCANIGQEQDFSIGGFNMAKRDGGVGRAESDNSVDVGQCQTARSAGSEAKQRQAGKITQNASVSGCHGLVKSIQDASADGSQEQSIEGGRHRSQTQGQELNVNLDNLVKKIHGKGKAEGAQDFVGSQNQTLISPGVFSKNAQSVNVEQSGNVDGSFCSSVVVKNSVNVQMSQSQNITASGSR